MLLSITPTWCRNSDRMERTSFADAAVITLVNDAFVAIRVDPDRRPDIAARAGLGGWPTTAFLTPDGEVSAAEPTSPWSGCPTSCFGCAPRLLRTNRRSSRRASLPAQRQLIAGDSRSS